MPADVAPLPALVSGTVALAGAAVLAPFVALALVPPAPMVVLAGAWFALTTAGLLLFYLPAFAKRRILTPGLVRLLVPLAGAAVLAPLVDARATAPVAGALALVWGAAWAATATGGERIAARVPLHRGAHAHVGSDRAVAAAALTAFALALVGGGLLLAEPFAGTGEVGALLLALGPTALLLHAATLHIAPRAAKRPMPKPILANIGVALHLVGALLFAVAPWSRPVASAGAAFMATAALIVAAEVVRTLGPRPSGAQARAARPLLLVAAALLPIGLAVSALGRPSPAGLLVAVVAFGAALAAHTYALAPVVVNQVPRSRDATRTLAAGVALGAVLLAAGEATALSGLTFGGAVALALTALAHAYNVAPMRVPRRECPPDVEPVEV